MRTQLFCYVFLSDFVPGEVELKACRWWTRGWTLQELLAPENLTFYDTTWKAVGTKLSLIKEISEITNVELRVLLNKSQIFSCSVSQRMSWAAFRKLTRIEDEAYCLLGIFGIHMPLLYGEGRMAFRRLQEEIIKRSADLTIFFWSTPQNDIDKPQHASLFAESPSAFSLTMPLQPVKLGFPEYFITNKGVFFSSVADLTVIKDAEQDDEIYAFLLGWDHDSVPSAIRIRKIGPGIFCRDGGSLVCGEMGVSSTTDSFYILTDPEPRTVEELIIQHRHKVLRIPHNEQVQLQFAVPSHSWDVTDRVFLLTPKGSAFRYNPVNPYPTLLAMSFYVQFGSITVNLVVLYEIGFNIFEWKRYPNQASDIFRRQNREKSILSSDFRQLMPDIASLRNGVEVRLDEDQLVYISVTIGEGTLQVMSKEISVWDIVFKVKTI
ncbi:hypothetical protein E0Z10_g3558 [Xylaria hypoxylon]|uniref:DUF8212 domain-containing protein n=1 Tax=Xylaria hypoxylon TaxID=37992 RepID=A0A4Z0Z1E2_9PEZI|nr:hypothetical protein E0Z10_g3558 [Xylaria hypoxylon]